MVNVKSRIECMQACVDERRFVCRSANYEDETHECWLSDMNRNTININTEIRSKKYGPSSGNIDYLEYNCVRGKLNIMAARSCGDLNFRVHRFRVPVLVPTHTHTHTHYSVVDKSLCKQSRTIKVTNKQTNK